jgi:SAM-dependent methyltransferase
MSGGRAGPSSRRPLTARAPETRRRRQRRFWDARYAEDPDFLGGSESPFARWCLPRLRKAGARSVTELGLGCGRDAGFFASRRFQVQGVELSPHGCGCARSKGLSVEEGDALTYLHAQPSASVDAVYSNLFFNMEFTREEHQALFAEVARVLRPEGLHLFSVRSTSDPWYGRGKPRGPDTFDPAPHGVPMHFFSPPYARELLQPRFRPLALEEVSEGEDDFPIHLLYVAARRRAGSA